MIGDISRIKSDPPRAIRATAALRKLKDEYFLDCEQALVKIEEARNLTAARQVAMRLLDAMDESARKLLKNA